jgi:hypothetical protein
VLYILADDDHGAMEVAWSRARPSLLFLAEGGLDRFDADAHRACEDFASLYVAHIEAEESVAFPAAQGRMDATAQEAMSHDMMRRRGVG